MCHEFSAHDQFFHVMVYHLHRFGHIELERSVCTQPSHKYTSYQNTQV